jgi:hypothetical protein
VNPTSHIYNAVVVVPLVVIENDPFVGCTRSGHISENYTITYMLTDQGYI